MTKKNDKGSWRRYSVPPAKHWKYTLPLYLGGAPGVHTIDDPSCPSEMWWCDKHECVFVAGFQCPECASKGESSGHRSIFEEWQPSCDDPGGG